MQVTVRSRGGSREQTNIHRGTHNTRVRTQEQGVHQHAVYHTQMCPAKLNRRLHAAHGVNAVCTAAPRTTAAEKAHPCKLCSLLVDLLVRQLLRDITVGKLRVRVELTVPACVGTERVVERRLKR